jgi:hypothetical protein
LETSAWFINSHRWLHQASQQKRLTLIKALEKEAGVDVKGR